MKTIRNTDYEYLGAMDTDRGKMLCFKDKKFSDFLLLVKECKFIDVRNNKVNFLSVSTESES